MSDTKLTLFNPYTADENALLLAQHLPIGRVWEQGFSPDSNIGKLLRGLAVEFYRFQVLASELVTEMDYEQTNQLLIEWEQSVGLPDSCFTTDGNCLRDKCDDLFYRRYPSGRFYLAVDDKPRCTHNTVAHDLLQVCDLFDLGKFSALRDGLFDFGFKFVAFGTAGAEYFYFHWCPL